MNITSHYLRSLCVIVCVGGLSGCDSPTAEALNRAPYPGSDVIADVSFDWSSHRRLAPGSDNFPMTWAEDGHQYTSWGDGGGFGGTNNEGRVSLGVARIEGTGTGYMGINLNGGVSPESGNSDLTGKSYGILSLDGVLYLWRSPGSGATNWERVDLLRSTDRGHSWNTAIASFVTEAEGLGLPTFLQFGQAYAEARDDFVYVYFIEIKDANPPLSVQAPGEIMLARVPSSRIEDRHAYEWFAGLDSSRQPTWISNLEEREPVFEDPNGVGWNASVIYNPGLGRYLLVTEHAQSKVGNLGVFDAPEPWGPWTTVTYEYNWPDGGQIQHSSFFWNFSPKWWGSGGQDFVLVFTGINDNDSWNTVHGSFIPK